MTATILVTGAAGGRQGGTGNTAVKLLRERGVAVRALVRGEDERTRLLREVGAEIAVGDLLSIDSVRRALTGIRRAFFVYPVQDGLVEASAIFAAAAREAGLEQVVNLSQLLRRPGPQPTPHQERHWLSEQLLNWAEVNAVHLDATVFYENLRALARGGLSNGGSCLVLPWGGPNSAIPLVSAEDVARIAVEFLLGPKLPSGTVVPLVGEVVTNREIAEALTAALGRPITYREISVEQWVNAVSSAGINAAALEHLSHLWRHIAQGLALAQLTDNVTDGIARLGGRAPKSLREFLAEQASSFGAAPSPAQA